MRQNRRVRRLAQKIAEETPEYQFKWDTVKALIARVSAKPDVKAMALTALEDASDDELISEIELSSARTVLQDSAKVFDTLLKYFSSSSKSQLSASASPKRRVRS